MSIEAFDLASCQVKPSKVVENKKYFNEGAQMSSFICVKLTTKTEL